MLVEMLYNFRDIVMGPNLDERRDTPRARCNIPLSCQISEGAIVCTLKDLSRSGARLYSDQKARVKRTIILSPPKGMGEASKAMKGRVAWCRPSRGGFLIGVQFTVAPSGWVGAVLKELGLSTAVPTQQRKHVRVPGDMMISVVAQGLNKKVRLSDLGIGGALFLSKDKLERGQTVRMTIPAEADLPELQLLGAACGCKKTSDGQDFSVSVKFAELTPKQRKSLVKHLSYLMRRSMSH